MINLILTAVTLASAPVSATPRVAPEAAPTTAAAPKDTKRYCVVETNLDSLIPKRVCRSRSEWLSHGFDPLESK